MHFEPSFLQSVMQLPYLGTLSWFVALPTCTRTDLSRRIGYSRSETGLTVKIPNFLRSQSKLRRIECDDQLVVHLLGLLYLCSVHRSRRSNEERGW